MKTLTQAQRRKSLALPAAELKRRRAEIVAKSKAEYEGRQGFALRWLRALDRLAPIARYGYDVAVVVVQQAIDQDDDVEWGFELAYEQGRLMELSNTRRDRGYNHGYDRVRPWGPGRCHGGVTGSRGGVDETEIAIDRIMAKQAAKERKERSAMEIAHYGDCGQ